MALADIIPRPIRAAALPPVSQMRFPQSRTRSTRIGGSGTSVAGGVISSLDTNAETKGNKWYGRLGKDGISAKMLRDPHVKQSVGYVTNPLITTRWRWKPVSQSPEHKEHADWLTYCFFERLPWLMLLETFVGNYTADGHACAEMTDDILPFPVDRFPNHPNVRRGRGLLPTGLHEIPANTISYWHKSTSNPSQLAAIDQFQPADSDEKGGYRRIEADRIVRFTTGQRGGDFTGTPILRSAYGPWKLKNAFQQFEAVGFERTAVGTPVLTAAENATDDELDAAASILENMRSMAKGWAAFPYGYTFKWEGAGESDVANLNIAIERCNTDFAVNVSAGFTRLGLTGPGSYALGTTQAGQYHMSTVRHAALVSIVMTLGLDGWSPAQRILEANYGPGVPIPMLEARNLPTKDIKTTLSLLFQGVQQGVVIPDDELESETRDMLDVGQADPTTSRKKSQPQKFNLTPADEQEKPQDVEESQQ